MKEEKIHIKVFQTIQLLLDAPIKYEPPEKKAINITAAHILGDKNIEADRESRELSVDLEWMLEMDVRKAYRKPWCCLTIHQRLFYLKAM